MTVRTRFAPSPTGFLHIGGVRTALFNWLFAKRHNGQFILRIDDTDQSRHQEETLAPILHGFRWLGMEWDEGPELGGPHAPYFQSQRVELYQTAIAQLNDSGKVYPCFCTADELAEQRALAKKAGSSFQGYSGKCRELSDETLAQRLGDGISHVLRYAVPRGRTLSIKDLILGAVERSSDDMTDFVVARADGSPLYNMACVVDDSEMEITHVIRAQEHLSNTWPQLLIYEALDKPLPQFAHVPYVAGAGSKKKLSKRDIEKYQTTDNKQKLASLGWSDEDMPNPVMLSFYEELGYLPDAIINGLARIGWSLDDKQERIERQTLLDSFSLERVNSAPASFDPEKLLWLQGEYMRDMPMAAKLNGVLPQLVRAGLISDPNDGDTRDRVEKVVQVLGDRIKVYSDIIPFAGFFFRTELEFDPGAVKKSLSKAGVEDVLTKAQEVLVSCDPFDVETLELQIRGLAESMGLGLGRIVHPLRVAVSGQMVGPGLFELLEIFGQDECNSRISQTLAMLNEHATS